MFVKLVYLETALISCTIAVTFKNEKALSCFLTQYWRPLRHSFSAVLQFCNNFDMENGKSIIPPIYSSSARRAK